MNIYQQIQRNKSATWVFLLVFSLLFLGIGLGADYFYTGMPFYMPLSLGLALFASLNGYFYGDKIVLGASGAREIDRNDLKQAQWQNVVEEMSIAANIPVPKTYFIDDPDPNAFATGRDPRHASIAVTRGLLESLTREEMQAVAAHEMSHIRNYDIRLMLVVSVLAGAIGLLADWTARTIFRRGGRSRSEGGQAMVIVLAVWIVAAILAPIISRLVALSISRRREYLADASGAELTRNPLALASALEKIDSHQHPTHAIGRGIAHLCIGDPLGTAVNRSESWAAELFGTHPPAAKRIQRLKEMAYNRG